jgi:phosphotransferase system IIB component
MQLSACAATRLRVTVKQDAALDRAALLRAGVQAVVPISGGLWHLIVGAGADGLAAELASNH